MTNQDDKTQLGKQNTNRPGDQNQIIRQEGKHRKETNTYMTDRVNTFQSKTGNRQTVTIQTENKRIVTVPRFVVTVTLRVLRNVLFLLLF